MLSVSEEALEIRRSGATDRRQLVEVRYGDLCATAADERSWPILQRARGAGRRGLVTAQRGLPAIVSARSHTGHAAWWCCPLPLLGVE